MNYKYNNIILIFLIIILFNYLSRKFEYYTDNNIDYVNFNDNNKAKNIIYCFWTGNNPMSNNRKNSLSQLKKKSECDVILITPNNLNDYILKEHPLHESYQYLSSVHKSDYLRTYFMNFYGGGYSDIKKTTGSWKNAFKDINNSDKYINGYKEIEGGVGYKPLKDKYNELIGLCSLICKPNTKLTNEWYNEMIILLDKKLDKLKKNPAKSHRDKAELKNSNYPIEWNEMLGRIFQKVCYKYKDKLLQTVPKNIFKNYK